MYEVADRVLTDDVLDLPAQRDEDLIVELEPKARRIYRDLERDLIAEIDSGVVTAGNALAKVLRLAQVTGGTVKVETIAGEDTVTTKEEVVSTAKRDVLQDFIEGLAGEPVVVFCRFHSDLDAVHEAAASAGASSAEHSGRESELEAWQAQGGPQVLAAQIQAAGEVIDLTRSRLAVYYSLGYSLGQYIQSRARVRRPGSTRPITYYHLIAEGTVDEAIYAALAAREEVVGRVVEGLKRTTNSSPSPP
jgi:SNF2 family DNA or RNA helicase